MSTIDDAKGLAPVAVGAFVATWATTGAVDALRFGGQAASGVAFWALASLTLGVGLGVLGSPGRGALVEEARGLPGTLRAAWATCGAGAPRLVAAGAAIAMVLAGLWLVPLLDAALAVAMLLVLVTPGRRRLGDMLERAWRVVARRDVLPGEPPSLAAAALFGVGAVVAFTFGALVASTAVRAVAVLLAVAVVVVRRGSAPAAAVVLAVVSVMAVGSATRPAHAAQRETVTVRADEGFVSTGIEVAAGEQVTATSRGTVRFLDGDDKAEARADGSPALYQGCGGPTFCGALVARIGDGPVLPIGRTGTVLADRAGELQLGVNDFDLDDNSGAFTVEVDVGPPPAPDSGTAAAPTSSGAPAGAAAEPEEAGDDALPGVLLAAISALGAALGVPVGRAMGATPQPWFDREPMSSR